MTLQEFKKYADEKAIDYGIDTGDVTIMACLFGKDLFHILFKRGIERIKNTLPPDNAILQVL